MPNFPKISGDLPQVLNPLNPRHYALLTYWVFFRPMALHGYLHQAAPDVDKWGGVWRLLKTWKIAAYRNVYLMLPLALALLLLLARGSASVYTTSAVQKNTAWTNAIAVTPNGQIAVTASGDRALKVKVPSADSTLRVWNLRWGSHMHTLVGHEHGVTDVVITPDGKKAVSGSRDRMLKVWDIRRGTQLHNLKGHKEWVLDVALTPDGRRVVSASGDKTVRVWDIEQGKILHTLRGHEDEVLAVAVTPDGQRAVSASRDRTLKVWDIEQGTELYTLKGHNGWVTSLTLTPDGTQAISASSDKTLKVWDIEQGKELYTLKGHNGWINAIALSPDGGQVISASTDQTLKVWDIQEGKLLKTLTGHQGWVTSVAITPDGKKVVSASSDQTVKIWDLGKALALYTLTGHNAWVTAIAVLPTTPRLLSASFEGPPKLWSLRRGTEQPLLGVIGKKHGLNVGFAAIATLAVLAGTVTIAILLTSGLIAFGISGIIAASVLIGLVSSLGFCLAFLAADRIAADPMLEAVYNAKNISIALTIIFGIVFGILVSIAFALSGRKAAGVFVSIIFILVIGLCVGIVVACVVTESLSFNGRLWPGVRAGTAVSFTFNLIVALGAFRLVIYPVQFLMALFSRLRSKWHPVAWDELLVLPVPRTQALLQSHLQASEQKGLRLVADVARNPFQRAWAQRALQTHLHNVSAPLHFLYHLLRFEDFNTYFVAPVSKLDWQLLPTTRQVLLGELAHRRVDCSSDGINQAAENIVWGLTALVRDRKKTPLTHFADLLYQLTYSKVVDSKDFNLFSFEKIYASLDPYPGGAEIADSFEALANFLTYNQLSDVAFAGEFVSRLSVEEISIRPTVLTALLRLGEIGTKVKAYQTATTSIEQLAILAQIASTLDVLDKYVVEQVLVPEQAILRRIIRQWRWLVSQVTATVQSN